MRYCRKLLIKLVRAPALCCFDADLLVANPPAAAKAQESGTHWERRAQQVTHVVSKARQPLQQYIQVIEAVSAGDFTCSIPLTGTEDSEHRRMAEAANEMLRTLTLFSSSLTSVIRDVGIDGKLGGALSFHHLSGTWQELTDNVNLMTSNLTQQVRAIATVTTVRPSL